jgi:hypothetical protein
MSYKFTDEDRHKSNTTILSRSAQKIFKEGTHPSGKYLAKLLKLVANREYKCEICNISEWQNKPLGLQVDHINGVHHDNRLENLRFICPNCHSQTETFCGAGNTGSHKVSDTELVDAIRSCKNIRQTLIKVGLTPKGGNYIRIRELMAKNDMSFCSKAG